jgi:hypothetical protein
MLQYAPRLQLNFRPQQCCRRLPHLQPQDRTGPQRGACDGTPQIAGAIEALRATWGANFTVKCTLVSSERHKLIHFRQYLKLVELWHIELASMSTAALVPQILLSSRGSDPLVSCEKSPKGVTRKYDSGIKG